jgi:hypothetical protein
MKDIGDVRYYVEGDRERLYQFLNTLKGGQFLPELMM